MRHGAPRRQCGECYFARATAGTLHCVRNAPGSDPRTGAACWPRVRAADVCGGFRAAGDYPIAADRWPRNALPICADPAGDYCRIPLTQGRFAKVDPEDYLWLAQFRWHCHRRGQTFYAVRTQWEAGTAHKIAMHRVIMDTPRHLVCDHINRDGLDDRKHNLRNCTKGQNNLNTGRHARSVSRFKGVYWKKDMQKWAATIQMAGVRRHLGYFESEVAAAYAYDAAAMELHGEYAALNFPAPLRLVRYPALAPLLHFMPDLAASIPSSTG